MLVGGVVGVEVVVHGVQDGADFDVEGGLQWAGVQDVLLHHYCFLVGLEEDKEVRF